MTFTVKPTMPVETMTSNTAWPSLNESHGLVIPTVESTNNTNGNEWEMIVDEEDPETLDEHRHVVILPTGDISNEIKGRPRSATVGGEGAAMTAGSNKVFKACGSFDNSVSKGSDGMKVSRRTFRRCASTPDLLVSDNDHEVIVEDESDDEEEDAEVFSSDEGDFCEEDGSVEDDTVEDDVVRVHKTHEGGGDVDDSFEVVSEKNSDGPTEDQCSEPLMVDEDVSMDTSTWTLTSAATGSNAVTPSVWGGKNTPSFKDILSKNAEKTMSWGNDKAQTEAMLRDSHRRHHLRVRTKPKLIVADDINGAGKMLKHAHSTGDLTKMMEMAEQERQLAFGKGRMKQKFSALIEGDDEGDFVIGRGVGGGSGGGCGTSAAEVLGDTDAMDYYHRKDKGSQSTHNKKKERPDEAKRKEISMYKKELQREKQQLRSNGGGNTTNVEGSGKKKKNEKGFGGKKERRRL